MPALLGGLGLAVLAAPFGAVMVWRRMAYFGDTLAHAGLLGAALALMLNLSKTIGMMVVGILLAIVLLSIQKKKLFSNDTILSILSHTVLAGGLVALSILKDPAINLLGLLYGDILAVSWTDLKGLLVALIICGLFFYKYWSGLLFATVHRDLAQAEGVPVDRLNTAYTLLLACVVALGIQIIGVLLMSAMLVIPTATARRWSASPEGLVIRAGLIGLSCVLLGFYLSWTHDLPTGPAIVLSATTFFAISMLPFKNK